jgi:hypothetical protein
MLTSKNMLHQKKLVRKCMPIHDYIQQAHAPIFANRLVLLDETSVSLQTIASRYLPHHKQGTLSQQRTDQAVEKHVALLLNVTEIHWIHWAAGMIPDLLNVI